MPTRRKAVVFTSEEAENLHKLLVSVVRIHGQDSLVSTIGASLPQDGLNILRSRKCKLLKFLALDSERYQISGLSGVQTLVIMDLDMCSPEEESAPVNSIEDVLSEIKVICNNSPGGSVLVSQLGAKLSHQARKFAKSKRLKLLSLLDSAENCKLTGLSGKEYVEYVSSPLSDKKTMSVRTRSSLCGSEQTVTGSRFGVMCSSSSSGNSVHRSSTDSSSVECYGQPHQRVNASIASLTNGLTQAALLQHVMASYNNVLDLKRDLLISAPLFYVD